VLLTRPIFALLFVCSASWLFLLGCQVPVQAIDWKLVSEMTYNVLMWTLNPTHSHTHFFICTTNTKNVQLTEILSVCRPNNKHAPSSQQWCLFYFDNNCDKYWPHFIILSLLSSEMNSEGSWNWVYHLHSSLLPYYLAKVVCVYTSLKQAVQIIVL